MFSFQCSRHCRLRLSFPTRRSSDLVRNAEHFAAPLAIGAGDDRRLNIEKPFSLKKEVGGKSKSAADPEKDRKSTRLNSSHMSISYAVFCLKKKNSILPPT